MKVINMPKLIIEFLDDDIIKISTEDSPSDYYNLVGRKNTNLYSLWYNDSFVTEALYDSVGEALGGIISILTNELIRNL